MAGHDVNTPARLPDALATSISPLQPPSTAPQASSAALPLPTKLHHRLARSPLQKRVGQLVNSFAVFSSTFSTS